ncbi:hypothetical protein BDR26DRAFT_915865 [Obelidium mucronatum]|nr:hypothetical protein BDR26DRAFT_915865 [Obelidium mucronatum]
MKLLQTLLACSDVSKNEGALTALIRTSVSQMSSDCHKPTSFNSLFDKNGKHIPPDIPRLQTASPGGPVSANLFLTSYYLEGFPTQNTVSAVFASTQGIICRASASTQATSACPDGMSARNCAVLSCQGPSPLSTTTENVQASLTICPQNNPGCSETMNAISSGPVTLTSGGSTPESNNNNNPPSDTQPPSQAPDGGNPQQPPSGGSGGNTAPIGVSSDSPIVILPSSSRQAATTRSAVVGSNNNNSPTFPGGQQSPPEPTPSKGTNPFVVIGGGIGALIVGICAIAFFVHQRRRRSSSNKSALSEMNEEGQQRFSNPKEPRTSPDIPFGRPVKRDVIEERVERQAAAAAGIEMLPTLSPTKDGKYDPTVAPPKFKSLDRAGIQAGGGRRSNSLGRSGANNGSLGRTQQRQQAQAVVGSSTAASMERGRRRSAGGNTLERPVRERSKEGNLVALGEKVMEQKQIAVAAPAGIVIHPGYYDEGGNYHYFTAEQMQQLQQQQQYHQ